MFREHCPTWTESNEIMPSDFGTQDQLRRLYPNLVCHSMSHQQIGQNCHKIFVDLVYKGANTHMPLVSMSTCPPGGWPWHNLPPCIYTRPWWSFCPWNITSYICVSGMGDRPQGTPYTAPISNIMSISVPYSLLTLYQRTLQSATTFLADHVSHSPLNHHNLHSTLYSLDTLPSCSSWTLYPNLCGHYNYVCCYLLTLYLVLYWHYTMFSSYT